MVAMSGISCPVWIRVMRSYDFQSPTRSSDPMEFVHERKYVGNMFNDVTAQDLFKLIVVEWIREDAKIVNDVGVATRVRVDADGTGQFVLTAANIQDLTLNCSDAVRLDHAISYCSRGE